MAWTIYYKGISGHQDSVVVDETAVNAGGLENAIMDDETGNNKNTVVDGADALTYADCYGTMFVQRNGEWITDLTTENGKGFLNATLVQDGDTIICTVWDSGNKRERQQIKLGVAQLKRKALMSATPTSEVYYRSNNTFETDDLPTVYNTNNTTLTDNANLLDGTIRLLPKRPWTSVGAITAPGSIGESVDGDTLVELEIWYDGADQASIVPTNIADEDNINQWNDKSGLAHNLNFNGGNNKPTYESSDLQNGYGYVQFADGDLMSINPLASLSGATAFTVFVIARSTDLTTNATQILTSTENAELSIQIDTNGTARFKVGASSATTASSTVQVNEWNIYTLVYNATNNIVGRVNDGKLPSQTVVTAGAVAGPATMGASTYFYVGGDQLGGTFIGDIGEVIIFKKALSSIEYTNVENYLATKWGV